MDLKVRPRRLRAKEHIRKMVRETRMDASSLIYPMFLMDGSNRIEPIDAMPGQYRYTVDRMEEKLQSLMDAGVGGVMFFGLPEHKDEEGSQAYAKDGVIQRGLRRAKELFPRLYLIGDVCMCEYTSHGHCGILCRHGQAEQKTVEIDNDQTLAYLGKIAVSQAEAGADMVAPSAMMDGQILAIRQALDKNGYTNTPIMAYASKFASSFYGPFRDAAGSAPSFGDRKTYQMDYHNGREALREALLDEQEGADIIMVKPALSYGDVIREVRRYTNLPVAAYSVSGEYSMVKCGAAAGCIDETSIMCEMAVGAYRAGADIYITYFAQELAACMREGRIG